MEYKVIVSHSAHDLTQKVNEMIQEGWTPIGSHQVQIRHVQNRFRGNEHVDSLNDLEYTQTLIKNNVKTLDEVIKSQQDI